MDVAKTFVANGSRTRVELRGRNSFIYPKQSNLEKHG